MGGINIIDEFLNPLVTQLFGTDTQTTTFKSDNTIHYDCNKCSDSISSMDCESISVKSGVFSGICCCFGTLCCCIGNWITAGVSWISGIFTCLFATKKSKSS